MANIPTVKELTEKYEASYPSILPFTVIIPRFKHRFSLFLCHLSFSFLS